MLLLDLVYLSAKTNKYPEKTLTAAATAVRSGRGKIVDGNTRASPRRRDGMKARGQGEVEGSPWSLTREGDA
jgi:hypothetical protein